MVGIFKSLKRSRLPKRDSELIRDVNKFIRASMKVRKL